MRDALERLDTLYPGLMIKFGGHAMAAGLSLEEAVRRVSAPVW
jgi:single-stranded-DNA-specific exonuclease